jgi:hypothetical protein
VVKVKIYKFNKCCLCLYSDVTIERMTNKEYSHIYRCKNKESCYRGEKHVFGDLTTNDCKNFKEII